MNKAGGRKSYRVAACQRTGKRRYRSLEVAQLVVEDAAWWRERGQEGRQERRAYPCEHCGGWHITSQPLKTPLPKVSKKRAKENRTQRAPLVAEMLAERPWCEIRFDANCTGRSTCVHEKRKRSQGGSLLDGANLMVSCAYCNGAVEDHPVEAHGRGFVIRRGDVA